MQISSPLSFLSPRALKLGHEHKKRMLLELIITQTQKEILFKKLNTPIYLTFKKLVKQVLSIDISIKTKYPKFLAPRWGWEGSCLLLGQAGDFTAGLGRKRGRERVASKGVAEIQ